MAVKRLLLLAMLVACNASAADFGDIPASLALPAGTSVRRNAGNTGFESFTPGGGGGTPGGNDTDIQFNNSGSFGGSDDFKWNTTGPALEIGISGATVADTGDIRVPKNFTIEARNNADGDNFVILKKKVTSGHDDLVIGDLSAGAALTFNGIGNSTTLQAGADGEIFLRAAGGSVAFITDPLLGFDTESQGDFEVSGNGWLALGSQTRAELLAAHGGGNPPFESVIYEDSTDHHFYGYNGTAFIQLDNNPTPTPTATFTPTATATPTATPSATATAFPLGFTAHFSRGGAAIQANDLTITPWTTRYPGTITGFIISADQGTCTLKVWKKATGTAIPTIADVINTSGVSLATGTHIDSTTVTDFTTTTVSIGDQFMAQVTAVSGGTTDITFQISIRQ